jgi:signal transduction histidine kinase
LKKRILFFLIFPSLLILVSIFYMNRFNQRQLKSRFAEITVAEGYAIQNLVEVSGLHLVESGYSHLTAFLDRLYENESIIYLGLFKDNELTYLLSRFEGFFPVREGQENYRILDTPMGKIFEVTGQFDDNIDRDSGKSTSKYRLHIGFDYRFLAEFEAAAGRNFLVIGGLFSLVILLIIGLVFYFDRKFFQKEMELMQEKQEKERFKELSLLTSEIAHEIKNPLNSIYLSFNVLEKHCSSDSDAVFYRDAIKGEINRISGILQSYSDLSREIRPKIAELFLEGFVDEFRLLMEEEFKKGNIDFQVNTGDTDENHKSVKTDKNLLKQILLNLVKNSMEAGATRITIDFSRPGGGLAFTAADNGRGIEKKIADSIFKPYVSTKSKGMGLGLHITARLVHALDGDIRITTHQPGNTVFQVSLPPYKRINEDSMMRGIVNE